MRERFCGYSLSAAASGHALYGEFTKRIATSEEVGVLGWQRFLGPEDNVFRRAPANL